MLRNARLAFLSMLAAATAWSQEFLTLEQLLDRLPPEIATEIQRRVATEPVVPPPDEATRRAVLEEFLASTPDPAPRPARVTGPAGAAARCAAGYIVNSGYSVSAADVRIVSQRRLDCDARGCRAFQVNADRNSNEPYELDVFVTCTG